MSMFGEAYRYDDGVPDSLWREPIERCKHGVRVGRDCDECADEIAFDNGADECADRFEVEENVQ